MAPPTAGDPWLTSRRFGIVIDAGSSGSRLQIYSWKDARAAQLHSATTLDALPHVEKGTQKTDDWHKKAEPGVSSFAHDPAGVASYLEPLLRHANAQIPPSLHRETPIFLLATAGMRLLKPEQQSAIMQSACDAIRQYSTFRVGEASSTGPCGAHVKVISGQEEGLFGWIAVNYLMDGFAGHDDQHRGTYGFLDMGGASTQIAFEPSPSTKMSKTTDAALMDVNLRRLSGEEVHHRVFVTTWLGYGTNQARERYVSRLTDEWDAVPEHASASPSDPRIVPDPCLPKSLSLVTPTLPSESSEALSSPHALVGTGSFPRCLQESLPLLNKTAPCPDTESCLFNGVPAPKIDFSAVRFIGVSEYWYSSEHVFGLGGAYDFVQYERAATEFCGREWDDIWAAHNAKQNTTAEADKSKGGEVVAAGLKAIEMSRLQMQCFKAAWIVNVLHEGLGLPRLVDPGGNPLYSEGEKAAEKADEKGLGHSTVESAPKHNKAHGSGKHRPAFQSLDTIDDVAISWTLGKMVLEASKEIPPAHSKPPPRPTHPVDTVEGQPPYELPDPSSPGPFSFSPFWLAVYAAICFVAFCIFKRLRRKKRVSPFQRSRARRESKPFNDPFSLEDGSSGYYSSSSGSLSPPLSPISGGSKTVSIFRQALHHFTSPLRSSSGTNTPSTSPSRRSDFRRTQSSPMLNAQPVSLPSYPRSSTPSGSNTPSGAPASRTLQRPSRPVSLRLSGASPEPSPKGAFLEAPQTAPSSPRLHPLALSLSRNSSQVNLTTLVPRTASSSRAPSIYDGGSPPATDD
ncbi:hypothetical protein BOTBODRAFT_136647 [Botryobasidium botryosum FD-172 SS1]|uniref:Uncharacterized protein n=1 Tax=Botryobasidium botryosum (strain FD-172 SS1) TaxID=930990 RepID=A0A067M786_BOTB1|nr:hypothetical protein BOTBODRAFT_136647 [Botryobasidium botryosum FD-172 SS1]